MTERTQIHQPRRKTSRQNVCAHNQRSVTKGRYALPVHTGAIFDTRIYGLYVRVSKSSPLYTAKGATRGEGGWEDPPPKKKLDGPSQLFTQLYTAVREIGYTIRILFSAITQTKELDPPTLNTWLRPYIRPVYTGRIYGQCDQSASNKWLTVLYTSLTTESRLLKSINRKVMLFQLFLPALRQISSEFFSRRVSQRTRRLRQSTFPS